MQKRKGTVSVRLLQDVLLKCQADRGEVLSEGVTAHIPLHWSQEMLYWIRQFVAEIWHMCTDAGTAIFNAIAPLAGAACISFGAWLIYRPAGFFVAGLFLLIGLSLGIFTAKV